MIENGQLMNSDRTAIYHALVDILPEAVCVIDMNQRILLVNKKAVSFIGEDNEVSFIGKNILDYIVPDDHQHVFDSIRRSLERGFGRKTEYSLLRKDGSRLPVEVITSFVTDETGTPMATVCLARNISEAKKNRELHTATAKRASLLADLMGHDISNQLQVMLSSTELLMVHVNDKDTTQLLKTLMSSILRCQWIIGLTEDMERLMTEPLEIRSLEIVTSKVLRTIRENNDSITIDASYLVQNAQVLADKFLERLLFNILENAYKHNPRVDRRIWVCLQKQNHGFLLSIGDNGPGIPHSMKETLFNPLERHRGVGLQFSRNILDKYDGLIEITDRVNGFPNEGTEVRVWIPDASTNV